MSDANGVRSLRFPKSIDEADQVLLWSMDEFIIVAGMFGLGVVFRQLTFAVIAIIVFVKVYRRFREGNQPGFGLHFAYWYGFAGHETVTIRNPFTRRYLP